MKIKLPKRVVQDIIRYQSDEIAGLHDALKYQASIIDGRKMSIGDLSAENAKLTYDLREENND